MEVSYRKALIKTSEQPLCHLVEHLGELALLVSGVVLVKDVLGYSLVNLLNSSSVCNLCFVLVACFYSSIELLDSSLELALEHLVLKSLGGNNFNALLSGFNVRHFIFSLSNFIRFCNRTTSFRA